MSEYYIPRFSFEISESQKQRADKLLNIHGSRKRIFQIILDDVLDILEEFGPAAIGMMLTKDVKPRQILPSLNKAEEVGKLYGESRWSRTWISNWNI